MKTETSRQEFLARVRSRVAVTSTGSPQPVELATPKMSTQAEHRLGVSWGLIAQFTAALEKVGGHVHRVASTDEAKEQLVQILRQCHAQRVVWADVPELGDLGLESLRGEFRATSVARLDSPLRDALAQTDVGITNADYAIAETGTLLLCAHPARPRLLTALVAVHVAVLRTDQVVPTFAHLASFVRSRAAGTSHVTLISGPSRTGDIEQEITIGAHGPRELHVILRQA
jgi:L-lactate dehydrogenase complex protein LldG